MGHNRVVSHVIQRLLLLPLTGSRKLSGLSTESSPDLGMSLPSPVRQTGHEMPPKPWLNV